MMRMNKAWAGLMGKDPGPEQTLNQSCSSEAIEDELHAFCNHDCSGQVYAGDHFQDLPQGLSQSRPLCLGIWMRSPCGPFRKLREPMHSASLAYKNGIKPVINSAHICAFRIKAGRQCMTDFRSLCHMNKRMHGILTWPGE